MDGPARRGLGPLAGGLALAVVVGGVAMAVALHGRQPAPKPTPTPTPGAFSPRPSNVALQPAPVGDGTTLAWDSTHLQLVADDGPTLATFDGVWHVRNVGSAGPTGPGVLIDDPGVHGVLLVTGGTKNTWLWNGTQLTALAPGAFDTCMAPSSGAWDPVDGQVVAVLSNQCSNSHQGQPSQTWEYDGQVWRAFGAAPDGVQWPALAWDPTAGHVLMLQATSLAATGMQQWSWTGRGWVLAGSHQGGPQPAQFGGAAFDAVAGGVVAMPTAAGPPVAWVVKGTVWSPLDAASFPERIVAVTEDGSNHRIVVLGSAPRAPDGTPSPAGADYLLTWNGRGWSGW